MRYAILLIILSLTGCLEKPDAWLCTFIVKNPLEKSYSFCVNAKTKEEKSVPISEMEKWITTDRQSYETFRTWYKNSCKAE